MSKIYLKALTLVELLVSVGILSVVLCGMLLLFVRCGLLNEANINLSAVTAHAQYIIEEIKNTDFNQIESDINNERWDLDAAAIGSAPYNLTPLNSESIDAEVIQTGDPLGISLRVDWNDRGPRARYKVLETLIKDTS